MNSPLLWGFVAGLSAVLQEYGYKTLDKSWLEQLPIIFPVQLLISYAIYRLVTMPNTSLLDAFIVFAFFTTSLRVATSAFILGETIRTGTWVALGLVVLAKVAQGLWGR